MDQITNPQAKLDVREAVQMFKVPVKDVARPCGDVDLMLERTQGNLRLLRS